MKHNQNDGHNTIQQIQIQPNIGLDSDARESVVTILNMVLADGAVLGVKTRSAHWNVHGTDFFEIHTLFGIQYQLLDNISDEIAERVRMLGGLAIGSFHEYINHARLEETPGIIPDILHLLADHETSIRLLREDARKCTEEHEDMGTSELLVGVMRLHEKMAWMLRSYIENKIVNGESQERT
jgi:starvation-inducible DNA-binding protein